MSSRLSTEAIRNAPFALPGVGMISFTGGAYDRDAGDSSGAGALHVGQIDLFVFGDIDGDGAEDALTFLSLSRGGPELYLSLEGFVNRDGRPVHAASYRLGDRVAIDSVTIEDGTVNLHIITQGPDDAPCCPTLHVHRKVRLEGNAFIEVPGS